LVGSFWYDSFFIFLFGQTLSCHVSPSFAALGGRLNPDVIKKAISEYSSYVRDATSRTEEDIQVLNQPRLQDLIHIEAAAAKKAAESADAKETGAAMHDFCGPIGVFFELRGNVPKWRRFLAANPSFIFYCSFQSIEEMTAPHRLRSHYFVFENDSLFHRWLSVGDR